MVYFEPFCSSFQKLDEAMLFALVTGGFDFNNDVFVTFIANETWLPKD